jgi:hypothetical protein
VVVEGGGGGREGVGGWYLHFLLAALTAFGCLLLVLACVVVCECFGIK